MATIGRGVAGVGRGETDVSNQPGAPWLVVASAAREHMLSVSFLGLHLVVFVPSLPMVRVVLNSIHFRRCALFPGFLIILFLVAVLGIAFPTC